MYEIYFKPTGASVYYFGASYAHANVRKSFYRAGILRCTGVRTCDTCPSPPEPYNCIPNPQIKSNNVKLCVWPSAEAPA